jgi:hypothetical protein
MLSRWQSAFWKGTAALIELVDTRKSAWERENNGGQKAAAI